MSAKSTQLPGQKENHTQTNTQQQQQQLLQNQLQQLQDKNQLENRKMQVQKMSSSKYATTTFEEGHHNFRTFTYSAQLKQATAGAFAAAITRTITQPLDVLKIRFQLQVEPVKCSYPNAPTSKYTSILQAVRVIHREEGVRAFWKGHNAGQLMNIVYGITQFWAYEQVNLLTKQMPWLSEHTHARHFISGSAAGCCSAVVSMPFDVIRTRLVAQDPNCEGGYRTISGAFPTIWRTEGVRGLFRGLASTVLQLGPLMGANFMFYKIFNNYARDILKPQDHLLPTWCLLITGGAAGVASKAGVYPLDFIKKRLQLQGFEKQRKTFGRNQRCNGILHCIELTLKEEGVTGFYKGMVPTLVKSGLTTALYFSIYDKFKKMEGI